MANKLSFSIAINLLTENFKRGTSKVKNGLRSMQMQVLTFAAALGAGGIGLNNFVSQLISVTRETNRANTTLKNVSGSMGMYADNQRYLLDLAKKYGVEINSLTGNFAKFTAAANVSGMSIENQRKIFESVSRATTAFGMSTEDSNSVFLALSQMMSKGKISSEELRLQMGEKLPIALQAMAKAAGVSVAGLDGLMKKGELMSAKVLPEFAKALDEMIPNIDTDNIETSVNRLKNAFTAFAKNTGIESSYKRLIDWLAATVQKAGENIKAVFNNVSAFVIGVSLGKMFKWIAVQLGRAQRAAMTAASKAAKAAGQSFDEVAWKAQSASVTVSTAFARMGKAMKAAFISALPTAILTVLSLIIAKLKNSYDEAKRIKRIFSDYKKESEESGNTQEVVALNTQLGIMNDKKKSQEDINAAQNELQKMLGVEKTSQEDLNKLVAKRVDLLKETAKADFYARKQVEFEDKNKGLTRKMGLSSQQADRLAKLDAGRGTTDQNSLYYRKVRDEMLKSNGAQGLEVIKNVEDYIKEYAQNMRVIADSSAELENSTVKANSLNGNPIAGDDPSEKKTALQKAEEKYAQSLRELDAKAEIEKMTKNEYNKALDDLNTSMYIDARGSADKATLESKYFKNLQEAINHPLYSETLAELESIQKKHKEEETKLLNLYQNKRLTEKEYNDELRKLTVETTKAASSISGIESQAYAYGMQLRVESMKPKAPELKKRDTTFDYKKSTSDIAREELDIAKDYAKKMQEQAKEIGNTLSDELANAIANVPTLEEALKIAIVMEDVKKLKEGLNDGIYSGVKDIATSADRLVSSFQAMSDAFDPESEASGWERLMSIWSALTNVVDSFLSVAKMLENITELTNKLGQAKAKEAVIDTAVTGVKVANAATGAAADIGGAAVKKATATANISASTAEGAADAGKSAAKLPFPWNIVAIGAAIAASMAAFALIPKFENGGVVGGSSYSGDKILARVNSGELILNKKQQSRLSAAIDSERAGRAASPSVSVSGTSKVRGDDIYLALSNHVKRTGKKSPWK